MIPVIERKAMNQELLQKMKDLTRMHEEYECEETNISQLEKEKGELTVPTAQEYADARFVEQPEPKLSLPYPELTSEEYDDREIYLKNHTYIFSLRKENKGLIGGLIASLVILLLSLLTFVLEDPDNGLQAFFYYVLALVLRIALIPVAIAIPVLIIILIVKKIKYIRYNKKAHEKKIKRYEILRKEYEQYQSALPVYQNNIQLYYQEKENQIQNLREEYQRNLPLMRENMAKETARIDRELDEGRSRLQAIESRIIDMSAEIGLAEKDYFDFSYVNDLKVLIEDGRADTMVDTKNLLVREKREIEALDIIKKQAEDGPKAPGDQEEALKQLLLLQIEQDQEAKDAAEMQGRSQCRSCQNYFSCDYRKSNTNTGNCAAFVPSPAG